jgi:hypothetical protein
MSSPSSVEEQRTTVAVSPEAFRRTGRRATFPGGLCAPQSLCRPKPSGELVAVPLSPEDSVERM